MKKAIWMSVLALGLLCATFAEESPSISGKILDGKIKMSIEVSPNPPMMGRVEVRLKLTDEKGKPLVGGEKMAVQGELSMPEMGHGGMRGAFVYDAKNGVWTVKAPLSMSGLWRLKVTVKNADQVLGVGQFDLNVES